MRAGGLNQIIHIVPYAVEVDEYGYQDTKKQKPITTRALITYSNGNRVNDNNEIFFSYEVVFTIRYYHQVNEFMRVEWENREYRILSIERDKAKQMIKIRTELIND